MVEKAPDYPVSFKAMAPAGLLGSLAPFLNTDITNPRELYSMLSQSTRHHGALLTSLSVHHNPQAGARLPPLNSSSEVQFRPLGEQTHHGSYQDLVSYPRQQQQQQAGAGSQSGGSTVWRSTSLQDVSTLQDIDTVLQSKKLKPILRGSDRDTARNGGGSGEQHEHHQHHEKGAVTFAGRKEVRLIRHSPLPPIEAAGGGDVGGGDGGGGGGLWSSGRGARPNYGDDPSHHHHSCSDSPRKPEPAHPEIFPRGQPVEVRKPVTPTYEDYPEAYWELRSPTVQEPSDLKEDMIDRDRYRLQQISSLRLRAMNREVAANRLDSYRRWQRQMQQQQQQQQQDNAPQLLGSSAAGKQDSSARSSTSTAPGAAAAAAAAAGTVVAPPGKQQRMSLPIRNHTLAVAAKSIGPSTAARKGSTTQGASSNGESEDAAGQSSGNGHVVVMGITEEEQGRRAKIDATARAAMGEKQSQGHGGGGDAAAGKPVKAAVLNLCIDPDRKSTTPTSDVHAAGTRKVMLNTRPQSDKVRTQFFAQGQSNRNALGGAVSVASDHHATLGSSHSHRGLQQIPSAPTGGTPPTPAALLMVANSEGRDTADTNTNPKPTPFGSKLILKKFNRLQVFGEKSAAAAAAAVAESTAANGDSDSSPGPGDVTAYASSKASSEKTPYLPRNRPPTYRLDMRNYPPRGPGSAGRTGEEVSPAAAEAGGGGYGLLANGYERGAFPHSSDKSEAATTALSFRFRNGEVVVSRQGKKPANQT